MTGRPVVEILSATFTVEDGTGRTSVVTLPHADTGARPYCSCRRQGCGHVAAVFDGHDAELLAASFLRRTPPTI